MELYVVGISNSYHVELSLHDRKPDGEPINSTLWKCEHEHAEFAEAIACGETRLKELVSGS